MEALRSGIDLERVIAELRAPAISTLLGRLAATPIFDRGIVELLHAVPEFAPSRPRRSEALARLGAMLAAPKVRSTIAPFADALASDPVQALRRKEPIAALWENARATSTRRSEQLRPLFCDADVEAMDVPTGWYRLRDTARERRSLESHTAEESLALETLFALYAAECAAGESAERHGHRNRLLRHLLSIDPDRARTGWQQEFDAADAAFDLPRCEDLIDVLASSSGARALQNLTGRVLEQRLITQARARLEGRLATADAWYRTTRYFERPALHARVEELLSADTSTSGNVGPSRWLLHLHAPGGSGKTMLLRWLVARRCVPAAIPVATIDFDAFALPPDTWEIVLRVAESLDRQISGRPLAHVLSRYGDVLRTLALPLESSVDASLAAGASRRQRLQEARHERQATRRELNERIPREVAEALREYLGASATEPGEGSTARVTSVDKEPVDKEPTRFVVVIDTLEQALYTHRTDLPPLLDAMRLLHDAVPTLRVVLAGRYDLRERAPTLAAMLAAEGETVQIDPFSREESRRYLALRGLDAGSDLIEPIVARSAGNPLKLALYADLVHSAPELTRQDIESRADIDLIYLVERIIARIRPELRWIVRYGVVPRRLTLDFVRSVLLPLLGAALRGAVAWDDPDLDLAELPPSLRRVDLFTRAGVTVDDATVEELWSALREFAASSSWVIPVPGDPNSLEFHSTVLEPMRRLLRRHGVFAMLHERAAEGALAQADTDPARRRELLAAELHHRLHAESSSRDGSEGMAAVTADPSPSTNVSQVPVRALDGWRARRAEAAARDDHELRLALAEEVVRFAEGAPAAIPPGVLIEAHLEEADAAAFLIGEAGPSDSIVRRLIQSAEAIEQSAAQSLGQSSEAAIGEPTAHSSTPLDEALGRFSREPEAMLAHVRGEAARLEERVEDALRSFRHAITLARDPTRQALLLDRIDAIETRQIDAREDEEDASASQLSADRQIEAYERVVGELVAAGRITRQSDGRLLIAGSLTGVWSRLGRIGKRFQRLGRQGEFVSTYLPQLAPSQRGGSESKALSIIGRGLFAAGLPGAALDRLAPAIEASASVDCVDRRVTDDPGLAADESFDLARIACRAAVAAGDPQRGLALLDASMRAVPEAHDHSFSDGRLRVWRRGRRAAEVERGRAMVAMMEREEAVSVLARVADETKEFGESRTEAEAVCALAAQQFLVEGSPRRAGASLRRAGGVLPAPSDHVWAEYHALNALMLVRQGRPNVALSALDAPLSLLHLHRGPSHHAARLAIVGLIAAQEMESQEREGRSRSSSSTASKPVSSAAAPAPSAWTGTIELLGTRLVDELERMDAPPARAGTLEWLSMLAPIDVPPAIATRVMAALPLDGVEQIAVPERSGATGRWASTSTDEVLYAVHLCELWRVSGQPLPAAGMLARAWLSVGSVPLLVSAVLECATRLVEGRGGDSASVLARGLKPLLIAPTDARTRVDQVLERVDPPPAMVDRLLLALGAYEAARGECDAATRTLHRVSERAASGALVPTLERRRLLLEAELTDQWEPAQRAAAMSVGDDEVAARRIETWWTQRASRRATSLARIDGTRVSSAKRRSRGEQTSATTPAMVQEKRAGRPAATPSEPTALSRLRAALQVSDPLRMSVSLGTDRTTLEVVAQVGGDEASASRPIGTVPEWLMKTVTAPSGTIVDVTIGSALLGDRPTIRRELSELLLPSTSAIASLVSRVAGRDGGIGASRAAGGLRLELTEPALVALPWEWAMAPAIRASGTGEGDSLVNGAYRGIERVAADRESVSWLQSAINLLGEELMVDGILGPRTVAAIEAILAKKRIGAGASSAASAPTPAAASVDTSPSARRARGTRESSPPDFVETFLERLRERLGPPTIAVIAPHGSDTGAAFARAGLKVERMLPAPARELAPMIGRVAPQVVVLTGGFSSDSTSGRLEFDLQPTWAVRMTKSAQTTLPRMEPSDLDHIIGALPRGRRPLVVLNALTPGLPTDAIRQVLDRNAFAGLLFRLGSAPAVIAAGGVNLERPWEPPASHEALADALAQGATLGEAIAAVRRAGALALRGSQIETILGDPQLFETILYAHDPRWRPAVGRVK